MTFLLGSGLVNATVVVKNFMHQAKKSILTIGIIIVEIFVQGDGSESI